MENSVNLFVILLFATFLLALAAAVLGAVIAVKMKKARKENERILNEAIEKINARAEEISAKERKYIGESLSSLTETVTRGVVNIGKK